MLFIILGILFFIGALIWGLGGYLRLHSDIEDVGFIIMAITFVAFILAAILVPNSSEVKYYPPGQYSCAHMKDVVVFRVNDETYTSDKVKLFNVNAAADTFVVQKKYSLFGIMVAHGFALKQYLEE